MQQARFAHAGVCHQRDRLHPACPSPAQGKRELRQFVLTADEGRQRLRAGPDDPGGTVGGTDEAEDRQRFRNPLQGDLADRLDVGDACHQACSLLRQQNGAGLGLLFQPGRYVGRDARDIVVFVVAPRLAQDHRAAAYADAYRQGKIAHSTDIIERRQGGEAGARRVVLGGDGCAE